MKSSRGLFFLALAGRPGPCGARLEFDDEAPRGTGPAPRRTPVAAAEATAAPPPVPGAAAQAPAPPPVPAQRTETGTLTGNPPPPVPSTAQAPAAAPAPPPVPSQARRDDRYQVSHNGRNIGLVDFPVLKNAVREGKYNGDTLLWRQPMVDWVRLDSIDWLRALIPAANPAPAANAPPPPPAAQQAPAAANPNPPPAVVPAFAWYLNPIIEGQDFRGPFNLGEIQGMWANGQLTGSTMVHRVDRPADYWCPISNDEHLIHKMPPLGPFPTRDWSVWIGDVATPFCFRELETAVRERRINGDTYVMHPQHAPHWAALSSVAALRQLHKLLEHLGPAAAPALPAEHQRWAPPAASSQSGPPAPPGGTPAQQPVIPPSQYQYLRFCTTCKASLAPYPGNRYCQVDTCRAKQY